LTIKVTLLNPEQIEKVFEEWGKFACECYDTPIEFAEKVGNKCFEDEHYSGSRTEYIKFKIEGVDRGVAEQGLRHEIGVRNFPINENTYDENPNNIVKNLKSFRYVDMDNFDYTTPETIMNNEDAKKEYETIMKNINISRTKIKNYLTLQGIKEKQATEDSNYVLPRATNTSYTIAFTIEALIHYMHKRLCTRTQEFHKQLASLMRIAVLKTLPQLEDKLVPQCEYLLWCPEENKCCGKKPTKKMLLERLNK